MQTNLELIIADTIETADLSVAHQKPSVDVQHLVVQVFGIDDARELVRAMSMRSVSSGEYVFVVQTASITREAQNALLKIFEEPPVGSRIILIIPHESILLPTLRSRFVSVKVAKVMELAVGEQFLQLPIAEQLALIAQKAKDKDHAWFESMIKEIGNTTQNQSPEFMRALFVSENYVRNRGASRKMLLEHVALSARAR